MDIQIDNFEDLIWIWHDAELHSIKIIWLDDDQINLELISVLNPYEDRQKLIELGITSARVIVELHELQELNVISPGNYSGREFLSTWKISASHHPKVKHHQIEFSGGSSLSFTCSFIFLKDWINL